MSAQSKGFCGESQITCIGDLAFNAIQCILFLVYMADIQEKMIKRPVPLNIETKSYTLLYKAMLLLLPATCNLVCSLLILFHVIAAPYYCMIVFSFTGILQFCMSGMMKKENDFFSYNTLQYREFVYLYLLISFLQLTIDTFVLNNIISAQFIIFQSNFLLVLLFYGFISLKHSNYRRQDMEKHLSSVLEYRLSNNSFERKKKKKQNKDVRLPKKQKQTVNSLKENIIANDEENQLTISLLQKQKANNNIECLTTTPQFSGNFGGSEKRQSEPLSNIHPMGNQFSRFSGTFVNEDVELKNCIITYYVNNEPKSSNRTFQEIAKFIKMVYKKYQSDPLRQIEQRIVELENDLSKLDATQLCYIVSLIQHDENLENQFGYFLEAKSANVWFQQFQHFVLGRSVQSFAPRFQKNSQLTSQSNSQPFDRESQSSADYITEDLIEKNREENKFNQIYIQSFDLKATPSKIQIVYYNEKGQKKFMSRQNSDLQEVVNWIINQVSITSDAFEILSSYTNNFIDLIKYEIESQLTQILHRKDQYPNIYQKLVTFLQN